MRTPARVLVVLVAIVGALLPASGAASQTSRSLVVTPDTDLLDGDVVELTGSGFVPGAAVLYCQGYVSPTPSASDCGTAISSTVADEQGDFTAQFTVQRHIVTTTAGVIDCAQPASECGIGAADFLEPGGAIVVAPLAFRIQDPEPPPTFQIVGTVTDPTGAPVEGVAVRGYTTTDGWVGSLAAVTDAAGSYVLDAEPLTGYRLWFGAPSGSGLVSRWFATSFGPDGVPARILSESVQANIARPIVEVDVRLQASGTIEGRVEDASGDGVAGVLVWGFASWDRWVGTYLGTSDADGSYRIEGVWPGLELAVAFVPPQGSPLEREWFDDAATRAAAQRIATAPGAVTVLDATLDAVP